MTGDPFEIGGDEPELDAGIVARFDGRCPACDGDIDAGHSRITLCDGEYVHTECAY